MQSEGGVHIGLSDTFLCIYPRWLDHGGSYCCPHACRNTPYDGQSGTDNFLNLPHVKAAIHAPNEVEWIGCSSEVDRVLGPDVMRSVRQLVVDLLSFHPVLLYQVRD